MEYFGGQTKQRYAFLQIKEAMVTSPVLALPDYNIPFMVEINSSGMGVGNVLMQNGWPRPYMSKVLSKKHQSVSIYE